MNRSFKDDYFRLRDAQGLRNADVARKMGIKQQALDAIIYRSSPRPATIERVAYALGVKKEEFACYVAILISRAVLAGRPGDARQLLDKYSA